MKTEVVTFEGLVGAVDCALDIPDGGMEQARGWALILHPHPLFGGARENKVVTTLSRACVQHGLVALRPNFRGVGASAGEFDHGKGETLDMREVVAQFLQRYPHFSGLPLVMGGFSFGSAVVSQVHAYLADPEQTGPKPVGLMLLGTAASRFDVALVPEDTLVIHGEEDDTVPLDAVMNWARPQSLPLIVIPGAGHFFHGKLVTVKRLAQNYLQQVLPEQA